MGRVGDRVDNRRVGIETSKRSMPPMVHGTLPVGFWGGGKWLEVEATLSRIATHPLRMVPKGIGRWGVTVAGKPRLMRAERRSQTG